jgi:hypothetical protein
MNDAIDVDAAGNTFNSERPGETYDGCVGGGVSSLANIAVCSSQHGMFIEYGHDPALT